MAAARNRDAVLKTLRKALGRGPDRRTYVAEISPLGLVEMTRQNVHRRGARDHDPPCPTCDGEGVIKSEETIAIELERQLRELAPSAEQAEAFLVRCNPR
jgi:ribonuclease G